MHHFAFDYLATKLFNNLNLALFLLANLAIALACAHGVFNRIFIDRKIKSQFFQWTVGLLAFSYLVYAFHFPSGLIPDVAIVIFSVWALIHLRQDVSRLIFVSALLLVYFLCFSPDKFDIEFDNRYFTVIKPFIYLIILYLVSATKIRLNLKPFVYGWVILYPLLLIWYMAMWWWTNGVFMPRPNFMIENNFEIPPLLYCFIVIAFIYRDKDLRIFLLVAIGVLLTGSRSGLAILMVVSVFYLFSLERKKILWVLAAVCAVVAYMVYLRGGISYLDPAKGNPIDRIQIFLRIYAFYDNSFIEILKYPLGVGIYQKIPPAICNQFEGYADWFTGNFYNCDPLMLQSFVARALYQFGFYVLVFIPLAYFIELRRRMGAYLAIVALIPIVGAAFSVGGFSNGLAFGSLLICLLAYQQESAKIPPTHSIQGVNTHA
jgi:hypothetical protein